MTITDFDDFCKNIFLENAKELVQHAFICTTLRMNEHKIHGDVVSILWYKMKRNSF